MVGRSLICFLPVRLIKASASLRIVSPKATDCSPKIRKGRTTYVISFIPATKLPASVSSITEEPIRIIGTIVSYSCIWATISEAFILGKYKSIIARSGLFSIIFLQALSPSIQVSISIFSVCCDVIISHRVFLMSAESSAIKIFFILPVSLSS